MPKDSIKHRVGSRSSLSYCYIRDYYTFQNTVQIKMDLTTDRGGNKATPPPLFFPRLALKNMIKPHPTQSREKIRNEKKRNGKKKETKQNSGVKTKGKKRGRLKASHVFIQHLTVCLRAFTSSSFSYFFCFCLGQRDTLAFLFFLQFFWWSNVTRCKKEVSSFVFRPYYLKSSRRL